MIAHKLYAIYLCATVRFCLMRAYAQVMWAGFKLDCRVLWAAGR